VVGWDSWVVIPLATANLDAARRKPGLGLSLETAFDASAAEWLAIAHELGQEATAGLAHTPACVSNASDFGQMLAWTRLVAEWAAETPTTLVVCDDPWLFRHLRQLPGVTAGQAPALWPKALAMAMRGTAARLKAAGRAIWLSLAMRRHTKAQPSGAAWLLVYAHPRSTAEGEDAYFGDCPVRFPALRRVLHVDGGQAASGRLVYKAGRTASLHGWGSIWFALRLPFARWCPRRHAPHGTVDWLVRRAAAREAATAQPAAILWQQHCQTRWLTSTRPRLVAWPWENHAWERALVRTAHRLGVSTIGYQHSVVGPQMLNYSLGSNPDGPASIPQRILCSGGSTRAQLAGCGIPVERLDVGGALRFADVKAVRWDPTAPVFVALPFDGAVAAEMVAAAAAVAAGGRRFIVKAHPMLPYHFDPPPGVAITTRALQQQEAVSAVLFAATTVGLEAALLNLPVLRFRPADRLSINIFPSSITAPVTDARHLGQHLDSVVPIPGIARDQVFAPVNLELWSELFA
jgi:hypothetical protein